MARNAASEWSRRDVEWSRLMATAQKGDFRAYECLLGQIRPLIRRIVAPRHRNIDRVEDVVQDVLLTVHRVRYTYDPSRPFSHWLAAIAQRRSIDVLRRTGRIERREVSDDIAYASYSDALADRTIEMRQKSKELNKAISALPSSQRMALELLKLREMSLAEASAETGRSVNSLKIAAHRAVKTLRLYMARE
ncbi:MAG TPA: sigma-70 family RNA polymerase sigma factor [Aliidongia sp.]|nr:sigma-70 family RNA polymerase sigma factor [Aliidongia sp.]